MTRRFLDDIKSDISSLMADNVTGDFLLSQDRQIRNDIIDSVIDDECEIFTSTVVSSLTTTTSFVSLTTSIYSGTTGGDATFLKADQVNGVIQSASTAGYTYSATANISFEGTSNIAYEVGIGINGVVSDFVAGTTGQGASDPVHITTRVLDISSSANTDYSIMIRSPEGANSIANLSANLNLTVKPTNNP
jgi:hypothetical protein